MSHRTRFSDYLFALISVCFAALAALLLEKIDQDTSTLFFVAVMCSTWYGGFRPGLVATLLSGFFTAFVLSEPKFTLNIGTDDYVRLVVFLGAAILISSLQASSRRALALSEKDRQEAEAANRAKDHLFAVVSHELRTPLNPALVAVSALEGDENIPAQARQDLSLVRRNIELEARLIDDLLDVARLSNGKLRMNLEIVDVHDVLNDAVRICRTDAADKDLNISVQLDAPKHHVRGDPARLRQVFWNILRNAIKFTPLKGGISLQTSNDSGGGLTVKITDSGIGMTTQTIQRIFQPFEQGRESIGGRLGGLGLGLSISRQLVVLHGGQIGAASEGKDRGSSISVAIPTAPAPAVVAKPREAKPAPRERNLHPGERLKLLLVEDHSDTLRVMAQILRAANHDVTPADSIGAALQRASEQQFDVVISDVGLPDGTGYELMRLLRQKYNVHGIALTGYATSEDIASSRDAGFDAHLTKPVDFDRLEATIERVAKS